MNGLKAVLFLVLIIFTIPVTTLICLVYSSRSDMPVQNNNTVLESTTIDETEQVYYIICDVVNTYTDNGTHVICEMPNGEQRDYEIIDAPLGDIELVCFATENQEDYTYYKIVALR